MFQKDKPIKLAGRKLQELREYIAERDPICRNCEERPSVDSHHVIKRSTLRLDTPRNMVGLCRKCHDLIEAYKIKLSIKAVEFLEEEPEFLGK
jgi:5-methylcytosine-specific restriction endonuclease McrA